MDKAPNGVIRETWPFPKDVTHLVFNSNDEQTVTVPEGARYVRPAVSTIFFWKTAGVAAVPVGEVADGTGVAVLTPNDSTPLEVASVTSFSIIVDPDSLAATAGGIAYASFSWYGGIS